MRSKKEVNENQFLGSCAKISKQEPSCRFYALYDKAYRADILSHAYNLVRANKGSAGIDGVTFEDIEAKEGATAFLAELAEALRIECQRQRAGKGACPAVKSIGKPA